MVPWMVDIFVIKPLYCIEPFRVQTEKEPYKMQNKKTLTIIHSSQIGATE